MYNRFTERARRVLTLAREEARRFGHLQIEPEHLLLGILREGSGLAIKVLNRFHVASGELRHLMEERMVKTSSLLHYGEIVFSSKTKRVVELSIQEARELGHPYVGTEHILLAILRMKECTASQVLNGMGVEINRLREEVVRLQSSYYSKEKKTRTPALDAFGIDLTELAREGKLDPIIGREKEIQRIIQILSRRKKNNPLLIGYAGVGKTAIVEGLAQKIIKEDVPDILRMKRLISLDLPLIVAGTKYRGQFEERIKVLLNEIKESGNLILFIDEVHTLIGAGAAEGAIDASNILKPALARGEIQCIGATTLDEYRRYIERDSALERRFQTIIVHPPSVKETIDILKGLKEKYENHHGVRISEKALESVVELSDRYISERYLPDKAIDVIDEACAMAKLFKRKPNVVPPEWTAQLELVRQSKMEAIKEQNFEKAAHWRDEERKLMEEIKEKERIEVTEEEVAEVVSKWTGIPLSRLEEVESSKLLRMESELRKRVVGQEEAIKILSKAIRRSRSGLKDPRRPIGTFLFLGPTGVGKTELAKALAEFLFADERALIRLDMSEFMEKFSVARLIGSPPGYVGYEEGGELTEKVRRRPYSVVLLDEIEKAHPEVFNILLQVMDEGRLSDALHHTVDFRNTVLIMTSNLGTSYVKKQSSIGFKKEKENTEYQELKKKLLEEAKKLFRPEFLNRLDEMIVFKPLTYKNLKEIVNILLKEVESKLSSHQIELKLSKKAKEFIIKKGYDPTFGARPLRRTLEKYIEDPLAELILKGDVTPQSKVEIVVARGKLKFRCITKALVPLV
ncbi:ATP-dependent Clp protease ATP-binding subunit [Candidatus Calescamantes bacterium]|nr:ATP-dependent Clp protease ATP-binding subunit [Candidatus Calescamantes bacterium]